MKRFIPLLAVVVALGYLAAAWFVRPNKSEYDLDGFARLPVLSNGRIKPMDTVARSSLLLLQGRQRFTTPEGEKLTPTAWLLDVFFRPERADTYKHFELVHPDVLALFHLTPEDGDGKKRFSYLQLADHLAELDRQASLAGAVETAQRDPFQRAVLNARRQILHYQQLKHSLVYPDGQDFLGRLHQLQDEMEAGIAAVRARRDGQPHDEELAQRIVRAGEAFMRMQQIGSLLPIPPLQSTGDPLAWINTGQSLLESFQSGSVNPYAMTYAGLGHAWRSQSPQQFNTIVRLYTEQLQNRFGPQLQKAGIETKFNGAEPFYRSMVLYVVAFVLAVLSWLRWPETLGRMGEVVLAVAWVGTTVGIATRMWLEGRPPVTNLYSSALFVGWGSVALCLVLERIYRNGIASVAGGTIGFCALLIAHHLSLGGDTLEMMRAVLDSNFWLATHVIVVTAGYSATFLAGFLAIIYILRGVFTRSLDRTTAVSLERMVYGIVCFATLFSLVGTILGGIWADQSWGRFWGWDPKENGALMIVMWNAVILHARWGGLARARGLMALAIVGNIITSWSWFGTNMLGVGLHSYGFMDAAFFALLGFVISQIALIAIAYIPEEKWRSAPLLAAAPSRAPRAEQLADEPSPAARS